MKRPGESLMRCKDVARNVEGGQNAPPRPGGIRVKPTVHLAEEGGLADLRVRKWVYVFVVGGNFSFSWRNSVVLRPCMIAVIL